MWFKGNTKDLCWSFAGFLIFALGLLVMVYSSYFCMAIGFRFIAQIINNTISTITIANLSF